MNLLDFLKPKKEEEKETNLQVSVISENEILDGMTNGFCEGSRNQNFIRIAGMLRQHGHDQKMIFAIIRAINIATKTELPETEIQTISRSAAKYQVKSDERAPQTTDIITMKQAAQKWVNRYDQNLINNLSFGFNNINNAISGFSQGEVFYIAARSGTGKTNLGMQISKNIASSTNSNVLMFSLEMQSEKIFFRAASIEYASKHDFVDIDAKGVAKIIREDSNFMATACYDWRKLLIVDKDALTLDQIDGYIDMAREQGDITTITIDYLGYINDTTKGSQYEKVSRVAKGAKSLAKRKDVRVIMLCQTSRQGEDGSIPVKLHHLRDSGAIEESADYILGLWKDCQIENRLHCEVLKNRDYFDGQKFDFIKTGLNLKEDVFNESERKNKNNSEY